MNAINTKITHQHVIRYSCGYCGNIWYEEEQDELTDTCPACGSETWHTFKYVQRPKSFEGLPTKHE